jgi:hypothetical protein
MQFARESSWDVVRIFGHLLVDIRKFRGLTLAMALWKRVPKMTSSSFSIPRRTTGKRGYIPCGVIQILSEQDLAHAIEDKL